MHTKFCLENLKGRDLFGDTDVDGRITLKGNLKEVGCEGVDLIEPSGAGNHGNKPSGSIKGLEFLNQDSDYHLLMKDSPLRSVILVLPWDLLLFLF
jgi:hypothetical protein